MMVETRNDKAITDPVTVAQAATLRGVSEQAIRALIDRGRLRAGWALDRVVLSRAEVIGFQKLPTGGRGAAGKRGKAGAKHTRKVQLSG